ncbi:MAG: hypothetical protein VW833_07040 [Candidatus Neomarinimicrobiota bacterium]|jgi:hypothetical protein
MQKREKILLFILLIALLGLGVNKLLSLAPDDQSLALQTYNVSNLQNILETSSLEKKVEKKIVTKNYKKNFFDRSIKKTSKPVVMPVLDEIIEGPGGYAAIINGNFVIPGDMVLGFEVSKIEKNRVVLKNKGNRKILKRN